MRRLAEDYECLDKVGEGTFGQVFRGKRRRSSSSTAGKESALADSSNSDLVALKRIVFPADQPVQQLLQQHPNSKPGDVDRIRRKLETDGIPLITLREILILRQVHHPNIIELESMAVQRENRQSRAQWYFVFPFMDHDLAGLLDNKEVQFTQPMIKCYLQQMLQGLYYLHSNHIIHRDIKPANLLINNEGILKITDFGLARPLDKERTGNYTPKVVTRWYRAPEVCLESTDYSTAIDIWSAGCILGEMFRRETVIKGSSDIDQIYQIFNVCGTPDEKLWKENWSLLKGAAVFPATLTYKPNVIRQVFYDVVPKGIELLEGMLCLNPDKRITAEQALDSDYIWSNPLPAKPESLPKFRSSHEFFSQAAADRRQALNKVEQPPVV